MGRNNYHSYGAMKTPGRREWTVNQYAAMAEKHYQQFLPDQYQQLSPEFFTSLGEQIEDQIDELAATLAGEDQPDEMYLDKVGRLNAARQMARERVLAQMLPDPEAELETISSN